MRHAAKDKSVIMQPLSLEKIKLNQWLKKSNKNYGENGSTRALKVTLINIKRPRENGFYRRPFASKAAVAQMY